MEKQKTNNTVRADSGSRRRNRRGKPSVHQVSITTSTTTSDSELLLMEQVVEQSNMQRAWSRVKSNKGAAGVDGLDIGQTLSWLKTQWPVIRQQLLSGRYIPEAVRRVEIPKPTGGIRQLGIPTVTDRLIQQALLQVLQPFFDRDFSASSFGFRPGRSAHMAVQQSQRFCVQGFGWVVDMDLEKFFDRVNHDILMSKVALKIKDPRVLGVIRRYLQAGVLIDGVISPTVQGTPQGGPLSPLLSNILLDVLDKELERRGHKFTRYADDCNIYVRSRRSGERVFVSIRRFAARVLHLTVNASKSAVDRPWHRSFLGYTVTPNRKLKPSRASVQRFKSKVIDLCRQGRGHNLARFITDHLNPLLCGWVQYFKMSEVKGIFEALDSWIRRRLRCIKWRQWKRSKTRLKMLVRRGLKQDHAAKSAYNGRGPWWNAGAAHMNLAFPAKYFERLNMVSLARTVRQTDWLK